MSVTAVVGAQWGDEGKGRIVDYLAQRASLVIRFQGGANAGHTVENEHGVFKLHLIPSGIFNPNTRCLLGAGTAVDPLELCSELDQLKKASIDVSNLIICSRAHMVMPYHKLIDLYEERFRGKQKIGTTVKGIGPCYADKSARNGFRISDLFTMDTLAFRQRLEHILKVKAAYLQALGSQTEGSENSPLEDLLNIDNIIAQLQSTAEELLPRIVDSMTLVREAIEYKEHILLEGQLGVMKDLDWGTYPNVTSSNPTSAGAFSGAGVPPQYLSDVVGVVKAYSTSVGSGAMPTELFDADGESLRDIGREYGATTGRPRRCGWFDAVAVRYANWLNGFTTLAITKLDVLDTFDELKICSGYKNKKGEVYKEMPEMHLLDDFEPVYETWPGWKTPTTQARTWDELPKNARNYLKRISDLVGVPFRYVSVGPERTQIVVLDTLGVG